MESQDANFWSVWRPPANRERTHVYCFWNPFALPNGNGNIAQSSGDSGSATFAYIDARPMGKRWVFVGSGQGFVATYPHSSRNKDEYDWWIYGIPNADACFY